MEDLIEVLGKEEEQYQGLIELGKQKREVVIKADIKTLDEITAAEQSVALNTSTSFSRSSVSPFGIMFSPFLFSKTTSVSGGSVSSFNFFPHQ